MGCSFYSWCAPPLRLSFFGRIGFHEGPCWTSSRINPPFREIRAGRPALRSGYRSPPNSHIRNREKPCVQASSFRIGAVRLSPPPETPLRNGSTCSPLCAPSLFPHYRVIYGFQVPILHILGICRREQDENRGSKRVRLRFAAPPEHPECVSQAEPLLQTDCCTTRDIVCINAAAAIILYTTP
jgi:hypothetical protein